MSENAAMPLNSDDARGGLLSRSFLSLVATQFFVSLNDNMFRWLIAPIGKELFVERWSVMPEWVQHWMRRPENLASLALSLGLACFTLPFLVFASPAGYFADRFSKRGVIVVCKVAEIVIISLGIVAIQVGSIPLMFLMLFILGGQAAVFITSKLGAIPELVRADKISAANGLMNMASMSAIIIGTVAGNVLYVHTVPAGRNRWWIYAAALLGVAVCGWITSLGIGRLKPADPARRIPWNPVGQSTRDLRELWSHRSLFLVALGSTYFWTLGALSNINIDQFATKHLGMDQDSVGILLGVLTIGIGGGALLAGVLSRGKVELGLVPLGSAGLVLTSFFIAALPGGAVGQPALASYTFACIFLGLMGVAAGFYDIPLQSFLQERSPPESRGAVMSAYNFLAFTGMLAAAGVHGLLSSVLGLSSRTIFLISGIITIPVTFLILRKLPYQTTRLATRLLIDFMYRIRVEGVEKVPPGGALLVANHVSWADGVLLGLTAPRHPRLVAFAQYFESPWLAWFGRLGRIIPIGTTRKSMVESIRTAREALQQGELVGIFPEGGITRSGQIEEFRPGFLSILKDTDAPVVPVYLGGLWGSIFSYERGRFFWKWPKRWRAVVTIRFGKPIYGDVSVEEVQRAVEELRIPQDAKNAS